MECFENVKKTVLGVFGCLGETNARSKTSSVAWSFKRGKGLKRERERERGTYLFSTFSRCRISLEMDYLRKRLQARAFPQVS